MAQASKQPERSMPPPVPPRATAASGGRRRTLLGGKYEPVAPVGQGGMASVWAGYTHGVAGFRRKVAIKRVLQHLTADEKFERMFVEEAHIVAELNHPNIVQIHDFGRDEPGGYFIVMEWVEGLNLADYVRGYSLAGHTPPWPLASAIAIEMLRALSAAHERTDAKGEPAPVIHRDVTPANVLIGINGSVKLADFGLSRAANRPRTTDPGTVKGKVAYMAPELLDNQKPDARSDIYSVGVTLWEAITAQRLYGGQMSDVEVAMRVLEGEPSTLTEAAPHAPAELADVVHRALAHAPDDRFQSATEMIVALSKLLRGAEIPTDGPALARSVRVARKLLAASG